MRRIFLLCLFCFSLSVFAQELGLNIAAEAPTVQEYQGEAGETIRISARAVDAGENTPDLVLWIVHNERVLAYEDNGSESPDISITLPEAGLYLIYLDSFNGVSVGEAELLIETVDQFNPREEENRLLIDLPAATVFRHTFEADGAIEIRVKDLSGGLDPYIRVLDSAGELVGENDDHASSDFSLGLFDSLLSLNLSAGSYTLEIHDFLGKAGQLEISFN